MTSSSYSIASLPWLQGGMQLHLQRALEEVENRQQVQECLTDIVTNVEWAHDCNQQVEVKQTKIALKKSLHRQDIVFQETALVRQANEKERVSLADALVREIYRMSQKLNELYELRQNHQELSNNYDALVAKLLQAEERIQFMQEGGGQTGEANNINNSEAASVQTRRSSPAPAPLIAAPETVTTENNPHLSTATTDASRPVLDNTTKETASIQEISKPTATPTVDDTDPTTPIASANNRASGNVEGGEIATALLTDAATVPAVNKTKEDTPSDAASVPNVSKQEDIATDDNKSSASAPAQITSETVSTPQEVTVMEEGGATSEPKQTSNTAVVSIEEDDPPPTLDSLETPVLMHMFQYLDALDILNTAQVNISMYSRVDNLFGLGDVQEGDNSTIATADSNVAVHQQPTAVPAATDQSFTTAASDTQNASASRQPSVVGSTSSTQQSQQGNSVTATSATADSTVTGTTGTTVALPPLPATPKHGSASASTTAMGASAAATNAAGRPSSSSLFGFLQPRKSPGSSSAASGSAAASSTNNSFAPPGGNRAPPTQKRSSRSQSQQPHEPSPMNAAMANSMASKLSDAELNAIIEMTERLRAKDAQLEQMRSERERIMAQLDGTDAVKQFLVAKVRSMEESLRQTDEQQAKVAQQIASDQEVIAFLDGRVQELEESLSTSQAETTKLQAELKAYQTQAEQKATVLADMLRFERERVQETQAEFKSTKKLLVKEVKSCRAQIMALSAQNQAVAQENETLKRALLSSGTSSTTSPTPSSSRYHQQPFRIAPLS